MMSPYGLKTEKSCKSSHLRRWNYRNFYLKMINWFLVNSFLSIDQSNNSFSTHYINWIIHSHVPIIHVLTIFASTLPIIFCISEKCIVCLIITLLIHQNFNREQFMMKLNSWCLHLMNIPIYLHPLHWNTATLLVMY